MYICEIFGAVDEIPHVGEENGDTNDIIDTAILAFRHIKPTKFAKSIVLFNLLCSPIDPKIGHTVFCRIHAPPQTDAPPKFLDHLNEVNSSKIYMTTLFNDRPNAVLTIYLLHSMK